MPRHNSRRTRSRRHYDRAYDEDLEEAYDDLEFDDSTCVGRCCAWVEKICCLFVSAIVFAFVVALAMAIAWNFDALRDIHRAFLANFGLAPREVPLLFYRCGPGGPDGGQPFTEATAPEGGCFEEDEGD